MAKNSGGKKNIALTVRELLEEKINGLGYEVWDVEYAKEGSDYHLCITIDSENGIDIDDCEKVHRFIDPLLDEADPIEDAYILEVSSPGVERELRTEQHYLACIGEEIVVKLFTDFEGQKQIKGKLTAYDGENKSVSLACAGDKNYVIPHSAISKAHIYFDFED